ncbi:uncharacterized protein NPIL_97221 [Nephila pilipes]|uniref:Uncharacterized protein n=1 Tax=Nephila pilipes TaxID=299642 RepID=A0A8X6NKZ8_NEPPI|nr:uncharacterized protein NPIL_97221 [Nephila pilipes]
MEKIEKKVVENKDTTLLRAALKHINILERFRKDVSKTEAFSSRKEYQKLVIAHFFVNELESLELEPDPTSKGFRKPVDDKTPSLEAFHMKPNEKEARRVPHFQRINKGDILHLKVIGETETDYKLIVLNKYGENKRLVDFSLFANLLKSYHLARFCRPLQVSDFLRATVLGKQIMEGNEFSRLIVSVNSKLVNSEYEGVELGLEGVAFSFWLLIDTSGCDHIYSVSLLGHSITRMCHGSTVTGGF